MWYDWSYMLAWIGVGFSLVSSTLFFSAAACLRSEKDSEKANNVQYIMPGTKYAAVVHLQLVDWIGLPNL